MKQNDSQRERRLTISWSESSRASWCGITVREQTLDLSVVMTEQGKVGKCLSQSEAVAAALRSRGDLRALIEQVADIHCPSTLLDRDKR